MMKRNTANPAPSLPSKKFSLKKGRAWFGLAALFVAIFLAFIFRVVDFLKTISHPASTDSVSAAGVDPSSLLLARVAQHVSLPMGVPSIEQVTQIEALTQANPSFYRDLEEGDWILRYPSLFVVYRAGIDRVVRVRDVSLLNASSSAP